MDTRQYDKLFQLAAQGKDREFITLFEELKLHSAINITIGGKTLLQTLIDNDARCKLPPSKKGRVRIAEFLLKNGVSIGMQSESSIKGIDGAISPAQQLNTRLGPLSDHYTNFFTGRPGNNILDVIQRHEEQNNRLSIVDKGKLRASFCY